MLDRLLPKLIWTLIGAACAFGSLWWMQERLPSPPDLFEGPRVAIERGRDEPDARVEIGRPLQLPRVFGNFELEAEVTLDPGAELGFVVRRVEPSLRGARGLVGFHGRFSALMLSSAEEGPAFRRREPLLFARTDAFEPIGGVVVPAEQRVDLTLRGDGRTLTAEVRGRSYGPFDARDDCGYAALFTRFGGATVHALVVRNEGAGSGPFGLPLEAFVLALCFGSAIGFLAGCVQRIGRRLFVFALPFGGVLSAVAVLDCLMPDLAPRVDSLWIGAMVTSPLTVLGLRYGLRGAIVGLLLALPLFEVLTRIEQDRLLPLEDPRLDALFGPDSAQSPFEELIGQLRSQREISWADPFQPSENDRILFLGGRFVWEVGSAPNLDYWHAWLATSKAQSLVGRPLEAIVDGRAWADSLQQWRLADHSLIDRFQPVCVVFGIPSDAFEFEDCRAGVRSVDETGFDSFTPEEPGLYFAALCGGRMESTVRAVDEERLLAVLERIAERSNADGFAALIALDSALAPGPRGQIIERAASLGLELVRLDFEGDPKTLQDRLAARLSEIVRDR
ncbi:MAG: hypothetical protein AAF196_20160 [Planctomycetota bacterium]